MPPTSPKGGPSSQEDDMKIMLQLTELSSKLMDDGNMDVYQETYESLTVKMAPKKSTSPSFDMFSDGVDNNDDPKSSMDVDEKPKDDEIQWEIKWKNTEDAETHGPFPSTKMMEWQETGYFAKGAYVRKMIDKGGSWYRSDRIDFDIYC